MQPRTIYGNYMWTRLRKITYHKANFKCEICGCDPDKGKLHAHELFSYDYDEAEGVFERTVALCKTCHDFIHSGRLVTMHKRGNFMYPKSYVLKVVEHGFELIKKYNDTHKNKAPLRAFGTFLDYLEEDDLRPDMLRLIDKYDISFYDQPKKLEDWKKWHVVVNRQKYYTPYKDQNDWEKAMEERSRGDTVINMEDPFSGGVFDELKEILKN